MIDIWKEVRQKPSFGASSGRASSFWKRRWKCLIFRIGIGLPQPSPMFLNCLSKPSRKTTRTDKSEKTFDALEWLAPMCPHVPDKRELKVRYLACPVKRELLL